MKFGKKDIRKIHKATREELAKLHEGYDEVMGGVRGMSPVGLLVIAIAGVAVILTFRSNLLDLIGLGLVLYPLYIFIARGAHRDGYLEGYYEMMAKVGSRSEGSSSE